MSKAMPKGVRKDLQQTNVGLRLLFDHTQAQSSAIIFLQWCVARPVIEYFRDNNIQDPFLFVQVFDPSGKETRHIFKLESPQEIIQFKSAGEHRIEATIIWGRTLKKIKENLFNQVTVQDEYKLVPIEFLLGKKRPHGIGLKRFGRATFSIDVPKEFFAPEMSAREAAWVNFFFSTAARDSCSIRRRRLFAYTLQPLLVAWWALFQGTIRFCIAFFFGFLLAMRCDWRAILHPFEQSFSEVWNDKMDNTSWLLRKAGTGEMRKYWGVRAFLTPIFHVVLFGVAMVIILKTPGEEFDFLTLLIHYLALTLLMTLVVVIVLAVIAICYGGFTLLEKMMANRPKKSNLEQILCDVSPTEGLRTNNFTPRLVYQAVKARFCQPVAG